MMGYGQTQEGGPCPITTPVESVIRRCNCAMESVLILDLPIVDCEITKGEEMLTLHTLSGV